MPTDTKYNVKRGHYSIVLRNFLCILCANDFTLTFWESSPTATWVLRHWLEPIGRVENLLPFIVARNSSGDFARNHYGGTVWWSNDMVGLGKDALDTHRNL